MPKTVNTSFLKQNEIIMMILHRHWIVLVFKVIYILFMVVSSIVILLFRTPLIELIGWSLFWGWISIYWIVFLTFIFISWINDELDLFVITNERIIGIEQLTALSRKVSETWLDRIQEVDAKVSGVFPTIFWYGEVHIYTASENSNMVVEFAPDPIENTRKINTIIQEFRGQQHTKNI